MTTRTEAQGDDIVRLLGRILEELEAIRKDVDRIERKK